MFKPNQHRKKINEKETTAFILEVTEHINTAEYYTIIVLWKKNVQIEKTGTPALNRRR